MSRKIAITLSDEFYSKLVERATEREMNLATYIKDCCYQIGKQDDSYRSLQLIDELVQRMHLLEEDKKKGV